MILKQLINPKPTIILFFIVFCLVFSLVPLLLNDIQALFLHTWVPAYLVLILGLIITAFHALGLNNLMYEKNIIKKDNLVLGFVYILLCTPFYNALSAWFISFFLLFYINYLFESYQKSYPLSQVFNASFILSLLSFFDTNIIVLLPLIIISGINFDNLNWRSFFTIAIGILLPYLFYFMYTKAFSSLFIMPDFTNFQLISTSDYTRWPIIKKLWIGILFIISVFSFFELFRWLYKKSIRSRKSFIIILFYFVLTFLVALYGTDESWYYLLSPLSIIIANYFTYTKRQTIANILFFFLIISSVLYRYLIAI
ncbi:DUF6427 family protein [Flavobacteriales bacterium]|nr:DUF6427 family protein [Flavobacteriales bacterium]